MKIHQRSLLDANLYPESICFLNHLWHAGSMDGERKSTAGGGLGSDYWRIWTADGVSNLADGVLKTAVPLVALEYTRSPTLIAGLAFAFTAPWLLFALPAGVLVDRTDRRYALIAATTARAVVLAALLVGLVFGIGSIWALYAVAFCVAVSETVYGTAAQSILPQVVARDQLPRANGRLFGVELAANEFVGPPLAGLLVAAGVAAALVTPFGLWIVALVVMLRVRGRFRIAQTAPYRLRADIMEGLRFVWDNRLLRTLAGMTACFNFATNTMLAVFILYATGDGSAMGLSTQAYGLLLAAIAAGSVLGSFVAEPITSRIGRARSLFLAVPGGALLVGMPAISADAVLIGATFFLGGIASILWNVVAVSLRQRLTPHRLLGRVNSAYRLVAWGVMPLGAATGGILAQLLGLRAVFAIAAAIMLLNIAGMRVVTDHRMRTAEHEADRDHEAQAARE
jgi:MFS family permease